MTDGAPAPALDAARLERLRAIVRKLVDSGAAPGAVLQIEQRGKLAIDYAYGFTDREARTPMRSDALFRLYSMTKPVTSVAAMRLIEAGKLRLDDPVSRFIPEFADAVVNGGEGKPPVPLVRPITIRDLLRHTAGLTYRGEDSPAAKRYVQRGIPAGPGVADAPKDGSPPVASLAELSRRAAAVPLRNQPGAAWTYGNATDVLGHVLEIVTGKPLAQVLQDQVLEPTGMHATAFQVSPADLARMTTAYVNPLPKKAGQGVLASVDLDTIANPPLFPADPAGKSIFAKAPPIAYGGAGLIGPAGDYLRFTQMMRQDGAIDGQRLLRPATVAQMRSNQIDASSRSDSATLAGLGFGLGFSTRVAPTSMEPVFPQCGYFWGGAAATFFWIDPAGQTSGVLMTQVFGGDTASFWLAIMRELYAPTP